MEAVLVGRNLKDAAGCQAEASEARDQGKKETLVLVVERAVEEDVSSLGIATTGEIGRSCHGRTFVSYGEEDLRSVAIP